MLASVALEALAVLAELLFGLQHLVLLCQKAHLVWRWESSVCILGLTICIDRPRHGQPDDRSGQYFPCLALLA